MTKLFHSRTKSFLIATKRVGLADSIKEASHPVPPLALMAFAKSKAAEISDALLQRAICPSRVELNSRCALVGSDISICLRNNCVNRARQKPRKADGAKQRGTDKVGAFHGRGSERLGNP